MELRDVTDWAPSGGMLAVELAGPIPAIAASRVEDATGGRFSILVTLHGCPLAMTQVAAPPTGVSAEQLATMLWRLPEIAEHLRSDGLVVPDDLPVSGLDATPTPPCLARRRRAMADAPSFTVLVATRDRTESLLRCLTSIAALDYPAFDVVVVDSAPTTDATRRALEQMAGRVGRARLTYVHETLPGLARAHAAGLAAVTGAWVAITDDDVVVDPQWLASLAEAITWGDDVACVTGLILPAELLTPAQSLLEQYGGFARGFVPRLFDEHGNRPIDPLFPLTAGRFGSGANMAYRVDALRTAGGFDPVLGAGTPARGGDDLAGFLRVIRRGHTLAYQPSAIIWHHHRREYDGLRRQARHYGVGLGAYLTDAIVREPRLGVLLGRRCIAAVRHLFGDASPKNSSKGAGFPKELERAERLGILLGPFAYVRSRLALRGAR
jgi:GT2 family glycosyltransferase